MNNFSTAALSMLLGAAIGAAVIQGLHAQAKPPAYVIVEVDMSNPEAYAKEYGPLAQKAMKDSGAKYLARAPAKSESFDGEPPKSRIGLIAFENIDVARAAFTSPDYLQARKIGEKYAKFRIFALEGTPQ
jgi:uncharacterized protein (DUF1330 family)